jgi:hypothetical protein
MHILIVADRLYGLHKLQSTEHRSQITESTEHRDRGPMALLSSVSSLLLAVGLGAVGDGRLEEKTKREERRAKKPVVAVAYSVLRQCSVQLARAAKVPRDQRPVHFSS